MQEKVHFYGAVGLRDGLVVLADEETRSYWDHITGECFEGALAGSGLEVWPIRICTAESALRQWPQIMALVSGHGGPVQKIQRLVMQSFINGKGFIPPFFKKTMRHEVDERLDRLTQGLGVMDDGDFVFYPMSTLPKEAVVRDRLAGRPIQIERPAPDFVPRAIWTDDPEAAPPMQLLSRWYGFSCTYPACRVFDPEIA